MFAFYTDMSKHLAHRPLLKALWYEVDEPMLFASH
jgi:hypothetical protein